ncbi:hypothetical protein [Streptomyces hypolithicus]
MALVACTSGGESTPPAPSATTKAPWLLSEHLARDFKSSAPGYAVDDATSLDRFINLEHTDWYRECFKKKSADGTIRYWVVPEGENCPARKGDRVPTPKTPNLVGQRPDKAVAKIAKELSYNPQLIRVLEVGETNPDEVLDPTHLPHWRVCSQAPKAGTPFGNPREVTLHVTEKGCPGV